MSFSRANAVGWALNEVLTSAQMNVVDQNQSRALDGNAGGPYSPSADIVFPGAFSIRWDTGRYPKLTSRTVRRPQRLAISATTTIGGSADFGHNSAGLLVQNYVDPGSANVNCMIHLDNLIDKATLTGAGVTINPTSPGSPTGLPSLTLFKYPANAAGSLASVETFDPTVGAPYADYHDFSITGLSEAIDLSASDRATYILRFRGEGDAGANAGLAIIGVWAEFTVTELTS